MHKFYELKYKKLFNLYTNFVLELFYYLTQILILYSLLNRGSVFIDTFTTKYIIFLSNPTTNVLEGRTRAHSMGLGLSATIKFITIAHHYNGEKSEL